MYVFAFNLIHQIQAKSTLLGAEYLADLGTEIVHTNFTLVQLQRYEEKNLNKLNVVATLPLL
jgi:hypothetical protein